MLRNLTLPSVRQVSTEEIARNLIFCIRQVEAGENLVVTRTGQPVVAIQPILQDTSALRPVGLCEGTFRVPDDFDSPLSDDLLADFEGN